MLRRITAITITGVFVYTLTMTAWKACGPKLTNVGEHSQAVITRLDESGSDGAHKPCVSLKSIARGFYERTASSFDLSTYV